MVYAAYLKQRADGRYSYDAASEEDAATMSEFLEDVAGGITTRPAPELAPLVDDLKGGSVFRVTDASAARGQEVAYLIAWEGAPGERP